MNQTQHLQSYEASSPTGRGKKKVICVIHVTEIKTMNCKFLEHQSDLKRRTHKSLFGYVVLPLCSLISLWKNCFYLLSLRTNERLLNSKLCADCFLVVLNRKSMMLFAVCNLCVRVCMLCDMNALTSSHRSLLSSRLIQYLMASQCG